LGSFLFIAMLVSCFICGRLGWCVVRFVCVVSFLLSVCFGLRLGSVFLVVGIVLMFSACLSCSVRLI